MCIVKWICSPHKFFLRNCICMKQKLTREKIGVLSTVLIFNIDVIFKVHFHFTKVHFLQCWIVMILHNFDKKWYNTIWCQKLHGNISLFLSPKKWICKVIQIFYCRYDFNFEKQKKVIYLIITDNDFSWLQKVCYNGYAKKIST